MKNIEELEELMDNKTNLACACALLNTAADTLVQAQFRFAEIRVTDERTKKQMLEYRNKVWEMSDGLKSMVDELLKKQKKMRREFKEE